MGTFSATAKLLSVGSMGVLVEQWSIQLPHDQEVVGSIPATTKRKLHGDKRAALPLASTGLDTNMWYLVVVEVDRCQLV